MRLLILSIALPLILGLNLNAISQNSEKAKVILWPGKPYLSENKMMKRVISNGTPTDIPNYDSCQYDLKMTSILSSLAAALTARDYNASVYSSQLEELKKEKAITQKALSEAGYSNIDLDEDVSNYAQADFNIFVSFTFIKVAGETQVKMLIDAVEPGTGRTVISKDYVTDPSASFTDYSVLTSLITNLLYNVTDLMDKEIDNRSINGRYIIITVLIEPNSSLKFNQLFDGHMLSAHIADIVFASAQKNAIGKQIPGAKEMKFDGTRMPYRTPKGRPQTATDFSALLASQLLDQGFEAEAVPTVLTNKAFLIIKKYEKK